LYRRLVEEKFIELESGEIITALQEQELRQRVLQMITCPELFLDPGKTIDNHILKTVFDLIEAEAPDSKVILFLHYRETVERYAEALKQFKPALIYGGVSPTGREESRRRFLWEPECRLLIANPKSAGAGFNFQHVSHTTIFGEPTASPGDFTQAMDRVVRPGQLWQCNTYILKALSTVAPKAIKEMLRRDGDISRVTLDRKNLRHFYDFA
jgi:superfamily II DNA or RNA helicase